MPKEKKRSLSFVMSVTNAVHETAFVVIPFTKQFFRKMTKLQDKTKRAIKLFGRLDYIHIELLDDESIWLEDIEHCLTETEGPYEEIDDSWSLIELDPIDEDIYGIKVDYRSIRVSETGIHFSACPKNGSGSHEFNTVHEITWNEMHVFATSLGYYK